MNAQSRFRSAFGEQSWAFESERAEFERIARELEGIAALLQSHDANSEQALRLLAQARQMRADSHLDGG